jgi:hypothetical protein
MYLAVSASSTSGVGMASIRYAARGATKDWLCEMCGGGATRARCEGHGAPASVVAP